MANEKGYGQFCPVSRAAEILAERWTPLVVRELLCGSTRFNDLHRGVPLMSTSLLSRRLKELEYSGIVERRPAAKGKGFNYRLTNAGRELFPIVEGMGLWAQRWMRNDLMIEENLDSRLLMWDVRRTVTSDGIPMDRRFVVHFEFTGQPSNRRRYWLIFENGEADLCLRDYGFETDLHIVSSVKTLAEIWMGHTTIEEKRRSGDLRFEGSRKDIKAFGSWFALSIFAAAGRQPPGDAAAG